MDGRKVIMGDNLSSHFTERVLELCRSYSIEFVCLPPNSTHLLQPLDVAFYAPLKNYWRQILDRYKMKSRKKSASITKEEFPRLLKKLYEEMYGLEVQCKNIVAGFEKCGIFPLNPERVTSRLPDKIQTGGDVNATVSNVVLDILAEMRGVRNEDGQKKRKRKLTVPAGQSISYEDIFTNVLTENEIDPEMEADENLDNLNDIENYENEEVDENFDPNLNENDNRENEQSDVVIICDEYYLIKFPRKSQMSYFVGQIIKFDINKNVCDVKFLRHYVKKKYHFTWPYLPDECEVQLEQIVAQLDRPEEKRRGLLYFSDVYLRSVKNLE